MKTLRIISTLLFLSAILMTTSCKKEKHNEIPFKANFYTNFVPEKLNEVVCTDPAFTAPNYQYGEGHSTLIGKFTTTLTFCSGAGFIYGGATGYLEAANGDRIFVETPLGQVILIGPGEDPVYDAYFQDPFLIVGGTGLFEGASGEGMTDSKVDLWNDEYPYGGPPNPDHRTDHRWTGKIILAKRR